MPSFSVPSSSFIVTEDAWSAETFPALAAVQNWYPDAPEDLSATACTSAVLEMISISEPEAYSAVSSSVLPGRRT